MILFFSSRRRHTRFDCDWSSDVCSSDLISFSSANETWKRGLRLMSRSDAKPPLAFQSEHPDVCNLAASFCEYAEVIRGMWDYSRDRPAERGCSQRTRSILPFRYDRGLRPATQR